VDVDLESVPSGAEVFVGGVLLGKTPTRYQSAPTGESVEFVFRLPGFEPERIRALPAHGLSVAATFSTPIPAKKPMLGRHRRAHMPDNAPSADIQTER
jgi:hypothetical protein